MISCKGLTVIRSVIKCYISETCYFLEVVKKEPVSRQKQHKKVLDKGMPEDIMPGVKVLKVSNRISSKIFCYSSLS